MLTIKVLGSGCPNCKRVEATTRQVLAKMGLIAQVIKVTDYNQIADYAILATPGLVINEKVVSAGCIPTEAQITSWIAEAAVETIS
jgi:small redox-active disulfide protein 2